MDNHPNTVVVNIACGMDTRCYRMQGMKELMPIYHVLGKIPTVRNFSNKIIVMEK